LREIDLTDIESLIPFVFYYATWKEGKKNKPKQVYADQVTWL
jgi:hypothetical protein